MSLIAFLIVVFVIVFMFGAFAGLVQTAPWIAAPMKWWLHALLVIIMCLVICGILFGGPGWLGTKVRW